MSVTVVVAANPSPKPVNGGLHATTDPNVVAAPTSVVDYPVADPLIAYDPSTVSLDPGTTDTYSDLGASGYADASGYDMIAY